MTRILFSFIAVCLFVLVWFGCGKSPTNVAGAGSGEGNALVMGYIINDNNTPAIGAKVRFVPVNLDPRSLNGNATIDSVITDKAGKYGTNDLQPGTYNLLAENSNSSKFSYHASIIITGDSLNIGYDTLKPPGSIKGYFKLQPGEDARNIIILLPGTYLSTGGNSDNSFLLDNLAEGRYHVRFMYVNGPYAVLDTTLSIISGVPQVLSDSITLPFSIPFPKQVSVSYDTLHQIVHINWSACDTTYVKGYNISRKNVDSNSIFTQINKTYLTDTFFVDSLVAPGTHYEYHVTSINKSNIEGTLSESVAVYIANAYVIIDSIPLSFKARRLIINNSNILYVAGLDTVVIINGETKSVIGGFKLRSDTMPENIVDFTLSKDSSLLVVTHISGEYHFYQCDSIGKVLKQWALKNYILEINGIWQIDVSYQGIFIMEGGRRCVYLYSPDQGNMMQVWSINDYEYIIMGGRYFDGFSVLNSGVVIGVACNLPGRSITRLNSYYNIMYPAFTLFDFDRDGEIPSRVTDINGVLAVVNNGILRLQPQQSTAIIRSGFLPGGLSGFGGNSLDRVYACGFDGSMVFVYGLQTRIPGLVD